LRIALLGVVLCLAAHAPAVASNFRVSGARSIEDRAKVAARCQEIRNELHAKWNGDAKQVAWSPTCEVVLHHRQSDYLAAVGAGGRGTVGATYIQFDPRRPDRVVRRRIDLLTAGQADPLSALPHEMTHVLLADRFGGTQPPPWLDEGVATLADSIAKKKRHLYDLRLVAAQGSGLSVAQMLEHDGPIPTHQRACFYGQSVALATVLSRIDSPARIFEFAEELKKSRPEAALRKVYNVSLQDVDRRINELTFESELAAAP
jgi:hypothetical protein